MTWILLVLGCSWNSMMGMSNPPVDLSHADCQPTVIATFKSESELRRYVAEKKLQYSQLYAIDCVLLHAHHIYLKDVTRSRAVVREEQVHDHFETKFDDDDVQVIR